MQVPNQISSSFLPFVHFCAPSPSSLPPVSLLLSSPSLFPPILLWLVSFVLLVNSLSSLESNLPTETDEETTLSRMRTEVWAEGDQKPLLRSAYLAAGGEMGGSVLLQENFVGKS